MRRALRVLATIVGIAVAIPVLLVAIVLVGANTDPGRRLIEREIASLTGGTVRLVGLDGRFPDALRLGHAELRDRDGVWLGLDDLALDWAPTALLAREAHVTSLRAGKVVVARMPVSEPQPAKPAESGSGSGLPVRVRLDRLQVARLELGEALAGAPAVVSAEGAAYLASLADGHAEIAIDRLDGAGRYVADGAIDPTRITARIDVQEPANGLLAGLAHLPDLGGPIAVQARLDGPRNAEATTLALSAGPLRAGARGTVDLVGSRADLDLTASAPAMAPRADLSWRGVAIDAHVHGPFAAPDATGTVRVDGLEAGGAGVERLSADLGGNAGIVRLKAALSGLRLPGPKPDLLAAAPLELQAEARLDQADRPVTYAVTHPLIQARGTAKTGGDLQAAIDLTLLDLQPLAAIGGVDIQGRAQVAARMAVHGPATQVEVDGTIGITGGLAPLPGLIGPEARIGTAVTMRGGNIAITRAQVDGRTVTLSASGTDNDDTLDLSWQLALTDLSALAAQVEGALKAQGRVQGRQTDLAVQADVTGTVGAPGVPRGPVQLSLRAAGLPSRPDADLSASGTLDRAPLTVAAKLARQENGAFVASVQKIAWKSLHADGDFTLPPGAVVPVGRAKIGLARLADLQPFLGQPIAGSVNADLDTVTEGARTVVRLRAEAENAGLPAARLDHARLQARVEDPTGKPVVAANLAVDGVQAGSVAGAATLSANGPLTDLALRLGSQLMLAGAEAQIAGTANLDVPGKRVTLAGLSADWRGESLRLLAPVRIAFGQGVAVDRLRASLAAPGAAPAMLDVAGKLSPSLDLTASLRNVTPGLAKPFAPDLQADGLVGLDARLTGSTAAPAGTVRLSATGMRLRSGAARGLPPANLQATAELRGTTAGLDARLAAGSSTLAVTGQAPLSATGPMALRATGGVDLALLDPILTPAGRRARGKLALDMGIGGTPSQPRPTGTLRLSGGEVQDYAQGAHITDIAALVEAAGDAIRITRFTGQAGPGTISATGSVGVLQPDIPISLRVVARNAQPLAADRLTANLDGDVTVSGAVGKALAVGGTVRVNRATINIPNHLPASVAVLDVRRPGQKPPPPPAPGAAVGLNLTVDAPGNAIFVRGHGLDSVLGGHLHLGGTTRAPEVGGGFDMQRGTFSLAGTTLTFTRGRVSFDGTGVTGKIDPTLDFVAESTSGGVTARLNVGGYADAPKITLSSDPTLPQDEVLAHLLFGTGTQQLGPFQIASIATALASITGVGGSGPSPLDQLRNGLGLDRLTLGGGGGNSIANSIPNLNQRRTSKAENAASLEAGRYVAQGVYVGAKQGTSGAETQAEVRIDITKRLKVETDLGSGRGGSNVGLTYQFEY